MDSKAQLKENIPHIIALCLLVFILLFSLVNFGYVRCDEIPGFCSVYYAIKGEPQIAIVYGEGAVGDPELLRNSLPEAVGEFPAWINVENVRTKGVLDPYQVVIVEGPKEMSTETLRVFMDYVQKGGRLVWVGDAGTELGENDYLCRQPEIAYLPSIKKEVTENNETKMVEQCGEWQVFGPGEAGGLNDPEKLSAGICGRSFGEIVERFHHINQSIYQSATEGELGLCTEVDEPYQVRKAERIQGCIQILENEGANITASAADDHCPGINPWSRGPSLTQVGEKRPAFDFSAAVLGLNYIGGEEVKEENLFLTPVADKPPLSSGYQVETQFFGLSEFAKVDLGGYGLRTSEIFSLRKGDKRHPAIAVSNPVGPQFRDRGLIVYFAFPPEIGYMPESEGRGTRLLNNLMDFTIPGS